MEFVKNYITELNHSNIATIERLNKTYKYFQQKKEDGHALTYENMQ